MSHVCQKSSRYEKYKKKSKSIPRVPLLDLPLQEAGCEFHFGTLCQAKSIHPKKKKALRMDFKQCCHTHLNTKQVQWEFFSNSFFFKDIEIIQRCEDPKACLKLAADDKRLCFFYMNTFWVSTETEASIQTMTKTLHILHFYSVLLRRNGETAFSIQQCAIQRLFHQMSTQRV